jgi:non-ribosomal peptide synthase protein (TIGR01720 family)
MVFDGSLRMEWHYHPASHSRQHVEAWADGYMEALTQLVDHCCNSENGGYTPADFPSVALDLAELDRFQALAAASLPKGAP